MEYVPIPPEFNFEDDSVPPERKKEACESRFNVRIDVEAKQLKITGSRSGVSEALRELYKVSIADEFGHP